MNTNVPYQNCPTAAPVVTQRVTVVRPSNSFDCSDMIYKIMKVVVVIILSSFGVVLLLVGSSLYSVDDFFQTSSIVMIVFGIGLITIAILICAKGKDCCGNNNNPGRVIQSNNAATQVVTQPIPGTVQYPGTTGYVAVTSQTYSPGVAGQAAAPSTFPAPAGGFSANYTYTSGDGKGPLPAYPVSTAGTYPPGTYPSGQNQGDAYQPGQHPPGLYSPGVYQPGAPPAGPYQPGAPPAGPYQPGAPPAAPYHPGAPPAGPYPPSNTSAPPAVPNLTAPEYQPPPPFAPTEKPPPYSY